METNKKFKCKDEVIYRVKTDFSEWTYGIFSHYNKRDDDEVPVINGIYIYPSSFEVLPYEGNEYLVGSTDEPDEEMKLEKGEWVIIFGNMSDFEEDDDYCLAKFRRVQEGQIYTSNKIKWKFAIRFKDFDPSNMEETKKHILCVKNGKVVRYKG